jgi:hypothetical protein
MNAQSHPLFFADQRLDQRPPFAPRPADPATVATGQTVVQAIHDCPSQLVLTLAGAGHSALSSLLDVAGASRTLLEALVPYSNAAFDDFLAYTPEQYVAPTTARLMAGRAYTRARQLTHSTAPVIGVGCTATIATDRPKRGDHRAHIALRQHGKLIEYYLLLEKGKRDRKGEEAIVGNVILNAIAESFGVTPRVAVPLTGEDQLAITTVDYQPAIAALADRQLHFTGIQADGLLPPPDTIPPVILSGAFNPLHEGHLGMARAAEKLLGQRVTFELAAVNVDKPPLPASIILERMGQFAGRYAIYASDAPTYIDKARLYPGTTFVVGYDTAVRIFAPRYYDNSAANMLTALGEIRERGCRFLVAGRVDESNTFRSLQDLAIPAEFQALFAAIPERIFRRDISSSELRAANEPGSR